MGLVQSLIGFLGRACIAILFLSAGIHKILDWQGTETYMSQALTDCLVLNAGNPMIQQILEWALTEVSSLLVAATIIEIGAGLLIFLGFWVRLASLALILFLIPTTLLFHHFWELQDPERSIQMTNFLKNVAIIGGLFGLLAFGIGCKSTRSDENAAKKS